MSKLGEEELNVLFNALSHEVRRKVVKVLGEKGKATYSELMNEVGISDSGTFAFHLRRMRYLVNKDRYGNYFLTDLGKIGYEILVNIGKLKEAVEEREEKEEYESAFEIISDRLYCFLSKDKLEKLRKENRKLLLKDILALVVDKNVTPDLFKDVVLEIDDTAVVHAPKHLLLAVESRCKDVLYVKEYENKPPQRDEVLSKTMLSISGFLKRVLGIEED